MHQIELQKQEDPRDQIWGIINHTLDGLSLTSQAAAEMEKLILRGIVRIKADRSDQARALEARENYRLLAIALRKNIEGKRVMVDKDDIKYALLALCPLYPIC